MAPVPGRTLRCPAKVDSGFAIGSMLRLQVPRVRMPHRNKFDGRCDAMGLGCVKTPAREEGAELFSLLPSPDSGRQRFCFSNY